MEAGEDPYLIRYYRIGFDGKGLTCLTPEEGMHRAWFSGDMKYLVDVYSMVDKVPVAVLRLSLIHILFLKPIPTEQFMGRDIIAF